MVVVSHLFLFLGDKFRGRCDSHESHLPLCGTIYFRQPLSLVHSFPTPTLLHGSLTPYFQCFFLSFQVFLKMFFYVIFYLSSLVLHYERYIVVFLDEQSYCNRYV